MLTRRRVVLGGLLTLISGIPCHAQAIRPRRYFGCTLQAEDVGRYYKLGAETRLYKTGEEPIIPRSGNRDFDGALARTLAKISELFGVLPGFAYYDEQDSYNAYATDYTRMARSDGTVLFGVRLLRKLMNDFANDNPDAAVAAVCAHEFGHIVQYKKGLVEIVRAGDTNARRVELQADFFAGYFAGTRKRERPEFPAAVFAQAQYNAGENMINHPDHHGTPDERAAAVTRGFEVAYWERRPFDEAIKVSVNYVSRLK